MEISNQQLAGMLRSVAVAYTLNKTGNIFQIRAYENAADSIEHSTTEIFDLWQEGNLNHIPGLGESLKAHLDEFFKTGKVKHWDDVKKGIPEVVFELLDIPGIGAKTALSLAKLGVKSKDDLSAMIENGVLVSAGFSEKLSKKISDVLKWKKLDIFAGRMSLPYADAQAEKVLEYLKKCPDIENANVLGSLRRMVATVGDLDFAVASRNPQKAVDYFCKMPGTSKIINHGENKATVLLNSGLQLDLLVESPGNYGTLLQHFTGSKNHNIHLNEFAKKNKINITGCRSEEELYKKLGMQTPPPEIREDLGEIEAALKNSLPDLVELKDIKGDLHTHSDFISKPSHDMGVNSIEEIVAQAHKMGYQYIGITDHQPSQSGHTAAQVASEILKKKKIIEQINSSQKSVRVLNLLEVDILPDGSLGLPDEVLELLDFAVASIHSSFHLSKEAMTNRILKALSSPYVKVLGHPTGRLIGKRDSYEVDWEKVFKFAGENKKVLEINSFPNRLDLRDDLVRQALSFGVKFSINTDAHEKSSMQNMKYGVSVARRGWATKEDIVNTWDWTTFAKWFNI
ncbi:MAG: PHP domain-containing protein [Candidatus Daviesbacteria bacterium]|nr:PHP domain-containing protein [Candidatus Daviesbacteria bacterium]